jgi:hypothetical protein
MAFAALTIDVNAKLANLEQGLQKASGQLDGFAAQANKIGAGLATAFGAIAGAVALDSVISKLAATVDQIAALDDAAESTGASVESLSSILNTLAPTGVSLDQITDAAGKLAKSMAGADEESSRAAEAFKAISVATKDAAGNLRPVDAVLTDVAKALAGYEDGTNKVVIAQALFGKSGAAMLPMLKDLATRQREAATVTTESAAEAERLANAWRSIQRDGEILAQSIASKIIPSLADLAEQFQLTGKAGGSLYDQIRAVLGPNKYAKQLQDDLTALQKKRDELASDKRPLMQIGKVEGLAKIDVDIADTRRRLEALNPALRVANGPSLGELIDESGISGGGKSAAPSLPSGGGGPTRAGRPERVYADLDALIRQADADEKLRAEAEAAKELAKELDRAADAQMRRTAEYDRAAAAEADADTAIERDVQAIKDAIDPTRALYRELDRVRELTAAGILPQDESNARQAQILSKVDGVISPVPDKVKEADDAARQLGLTFSSAFEDAIVGGKGLSGVLKGIRDDIIRLAVRKSITEPLVAALFGGGKDGSSSGLFSDAIGAIFGGPRANGGPVTGGTTYLVGERGPELFTPKQRGTIIPNGALGGGGGVNLTLNVASGVTRQELLQAGEAFMAEAQVRILQSMRNGGVFA